MHHSQILLCKCHSRVERDDLASLAFSAHEETVTRSGLRGCGDLSSPAPRLLRSIGCTAEPKELRTDCSLCLCHGGIIARCECGALAVAGVERSRGGCREE